MLVFVYGTLTDPERAAAVLDDWRYVGEAVLDGMYHVDGQYPTLAPGGSVDGRLLETDEVDRLDAYEGVDRGLYVRVAVPLRCTEPSEDDARCDETVAVYVGDPDRLAATAEWPGDGDFGERVTAYVDENDVAVRPPTSPRGSSV